MIFKKRKEKSEMEKILFHYISNTKYMAIITILDYEIRLSTYLSELIFPLDLKDKKVVVDLALKSGIDKYRFVCFDIDNNGKIILNSNEYVYDTTEIEFIANEYLKQKKESVINSFLTDKQKNMILY